MPVGGLCSVQIPSQSQGARGESGTGLKVSWVVCVVAGTWMPCEMRGR